MSEETAKPRRRKGEGADLQAKVVPFVDPNRAQPASVEAEMGLLSSYLLDPKAVGALCAERKVSGKSFHIPAHGTIYEVIEEMWNVGIPLDIVTVTQALHDKNLLEMCGGPGIVTNLFTYLPTAANAEYYIDIVQDKTTLREIIRTCSELTSRAYEEQGNVSGLLDDAEAKMLKIAETRFTENKFDMREQVMNAIADIQNLYDRRGGITGLSTGIATLDKMTDGLHRAEMIVIAARPSMGKTALCMNIADHIAVDQQKPIAVFSLEMSTRQLVSRLICSRAKIDLGRVSAGFLSDRDFQEMTRVGSNLNNSKMFIDDTSSISILELRAKCRRLKNQHGIEAVFIDYLQLLRSTSARAQDNRQLEIAEISAGIKGLAKELDIPIVVLAQLNRNPEQRGSGETKGRPRLSDLRESGSIEQDADVVGLLVREEYYAETEEEKKESIGKSTLIIAKQRNGPVGDVKLTFLKEFTRFEARFEEGGGGEE